MFPKPAVRGFPSLLLPDALEEEPPHGYELMRRINNVLDYAPPWHNIPSPQLLRESGSISS